MLIRSIKANNFMRFSQLGLEDLPVEGLVGIEGPNEAGKSTIGEILLFAFFGKTRLSSEFGLERLIRWNEDQMSVEVRFLVEGSTTTCPSPDGSPGAARGLTDDRGVSELLIYREIDRSGTNYVKLVDACTRDEIASGNIQVSQVLGRLVHFDFEEAVDSFFTGQLDPAAPGRESSSFLDRMTGTAQIGDAIRRFRREIEGLEREYASYQKDLQRNNRQISKYDQNISRIDELGAQLREASDRLRSHENRRGELQSDLEALKGFVADLERDRALLADAKRRPFLELEEPLSGIAEKYRALESGSGRRPRFFEKYQERSLEQRQRLDDLVSCARHLAELRDRFSALQGDIRRQLDESTDESLLTEKDKLEDELHRQEGACGIFSALAAVFIALSTISGALGIILVLSLPGSERFLGWLEARSLSSDRAIAYLGLLSGVLLVLGLVSLARRIVLGGKTRRYREEVGMVNLRIEEVTSDQKRIEDLLAVAEEGGVDRFIEIGSSLGASDPRRWLEAFLAEFERVFGAGEGGRGHLAILDRLIQGERQLGERAQGSMQKIQSSLRDAEKKINKARSERDRIQHEMREYEVQRTRREALVEKNDELTRRAEELEGEVDCRRAAIGLLEETTRSLLNAVGPALSKFVGDALPIVSAGRYRDVKVSNDLAVKLFTSERCDFLEPGELSGGTLEALQVLLRLACCQAFLLFRCRQPQFVFLDEPLKMLDSERTLRILDLLRRLSPQIRQVFIVQPRFPQEQRALLERTITTGLEGDRLVEGRPKPARESVGGRRQVDSPVEDVSNLPL